MITIKKSPKPVAIDEWLSQLMEEAAKYAFDAGLYDLPDEYSNIAKAKVRAKAVERYGEPSVDPVALREREAVLKQRGEQVRDKVHANHLWKETARSFAVDAAQALPGWRVGCVIALLFALWGFAHQERSWHSWIVLTLSATLSVLVLPALPVFLRFGVRSTANLVSALHQIGTLVFIEYKQARLESLAHAQQDLRRQLDQWVEEKLSLLIAEYQHNKHIAIRARLAA
jgi:hypothetical protein